MRPGDVVTCGNPHCGAQARARSTRPENWREGYALLLAWPDGRQEATVAAPARCLACHERFEALGMDTVPPLGPPRAITFADVVEVHEIMLEHDAAPAPILPRAQLTLF